MCKKKEILERERGTLAWFYCFFLDFLAFFLGVRLILHLGSVDYVAFFEVGRGKFGLFYFLE